MSKALQNTKDHRTSMVWEVIETYSEDHVNMFIKRTKVPGGWLVESVYERIYRSNQPNDENGIGAGSGLAFVPDPYYAWKPTILFTVGPTINN